MYANVGRLQRVIKDQSVSLVHARSGAPAWSAYFACKRLGIPFVTTFHGTYGAKGNLKQLYNSVMAKGVRVIAISAFIAGHLKQFYGAQSNKIRVIHRGFDLDSFNPSKVSTERVVKLSNDWRLEEGCPVIMLPGRLTRWKGQGVFIDAIAQLGLTDLLCVLVGI